MMRRLSRWAMRSVALHAAVWLALVFGPGLVGRVLPTAIEPATIEVVLGEGGLTRHPTHDDDASPAPAIPPPPAPPPSSGGPAAVRLGDAGKPPHADLLDPENNRFRAATQDTGNRMPS